MRAITKSIENCATDFQVRSDLLNFFVFALDLDTLYLRERAAINGDERARFEAIGFFGQLYLDKIFMIRKDVETKGNLIRSLFEKIRAAIFTDVEDVFYLVDWLDNELSSSADKRDVLKYFNWPDRKADAMLLKFVRLTVVNVFTQLQDEVILSDVERLRMTKANVKVEKKDAEKESSQTGQVGARSNPVPLDRRGTYCLVGEGEAIIRGTLARDVAAVMEYKGLKLQEAVDWVVKNRLDGQAGMIVVSSEGEVAYGFNSNAMFRGCATEGNMKL
ncbi:hypothetical protein Sjap_020431 [Stephania japonica]|uniref:Uncharacterized protein n=1 Tax=Stephania japonica TaxID=461633 RepID=A0AAP0F3G0_9MAGN